MNAPGGADEPVGTVAAVPSRDECITEAGAWLAETWDRLDAMSPRQQAQAAWKDGGPSVDDLEDRIRARRGLPALDRTRRGAA